GLRARPSVHHVVERPERNSTNRPKNIPAGFALPKQAQDLNSWRRDRALVRLPVDWRRDDALHEREATNFAKATRHELHPHSDILYAVPVRAVIALTSRLRPNRSGANGAPNRRSDAPAEETRGCRRWR